MNPLTLILPWPPSVNSYWRRKGNLYFIGPAGKDFRRNVGVICSGSTPLLGRLAVELLLTMPDRRQRDIDNYLKGTFDALAHAGVFENDNQIDRLVAERGPIKPPGSCVITITEIASTRPVQGTLLERFNSMTAERF